MFWRKKCSRLTREKIPRNIFYLTSLGCISQADEPKGDQELAEYPGLRMLLFLHLIVSAMSWPTSEFKGISAIAPFSRSSVSPPSRKVKQSGQFVHFVLPRPPIKISLSFGLLTVRVERTQLQEGITVEDQFQYVIVCNRLQPNDRSISLQQPSFIS